ncbi:MAG: thiosulfohydrolase SoxB [Planctomycetota bacterium]
MGEPPGREFGRLFGFGVAAGLTPAMLRGASAAERLYDIAPFGNVRLLHFTDCHAQLLPIYFREPSVNLGIGPARGKAPHLVGDALLKSFGIEAGSAEAHAFTYLGFSEAAAKFGKVGGFAHLASLVKKLRGEAGADSSLLLDGGDTWQGSGTALWSRGRDMVQTTNQLAVDVMTGHWEYTYHEKEIRENIAAFNGEFVAQNVKVKEDALFDGAKAYDEDSGHAFKPYTIKTVGGRRIAVVGQSFPYTPIANPQRFIPDWTFGINDDDMQALVEEIRATEKPDAVILLSHNGMDVDLKLASRVSGIDAILGGHTHDGVPQVSAVKNPGGQTLVGNSGSNGKFLSVLDLDVGKGGVKGYQYRLLPVFSNLLPADGEMTALIEKIRAPHLGKLSEELTVADELLYRRGNFNGTCDQVVCDALREVGGAQIASGWKRQSRTASVAR